MDTAPSTQYRSGLRRGVRAPGRNDRRHDRAACDPVVWLAVHLLDRHRPAAAVRRFRRVAVAGVTEIPGTGSAPLEPPCRHPQPPDARAALYGQRALLCGRTRRARPVLVGHLSQPSVPTHDTAALVRL